MPAIVALLVLANLFVWAGAFAAFHGHPMLFGTALLAYGLGLRHAVDADHIAAIDNVTRKLMQEGRRPVSAGLFFSLGHSTVVVAATAAVALGSARFGPQFALMRDVGGLIGTLVSSGFLLVIAAINLTLVIPILRALRRVRDGGVPQDIGHSGGRGLLSRLLRPLSRRIHASWQMYPLGFLFGLGFDTASEIGLLAISAAQATHGLAFWPVMVFPALFTAGMSLIDTLDGIMMLAAYGWAFRRPLRKLYYNLTITVLSALIALVIGSIEALGLVAGRFDLHGLFWRDVGRLNDGLGVMGWMVIAVLAASWLGSMALWRLRGWNRMDAKATGWEN